MNQTSLLSGNIRQQILTLAVPLLLGNILQQLYNTADSLIVGRFLGTNAFASVGISGSLMNLFIFILDGFEVKVQQVYDLDMNRIQSVTILKDASASAIYGSRAAKGEIVIETKGPEPGAHRVSYTLTGGVNIPDLSSYKLMNASQALEFQRLSGLFNPAREGEDGGYYLYSYYLFR